MIDLSAAFDCTDHDILLNWLDMSYGIQSIANQWLMSYRSCRTQCVRHNDLTLPSEIMWLGVLQGSVLRPLLFLPYTADVYHIITKDGIRSHYHDYYADDLLLHISCHSDEAQQCLTWERTVYCMADINTWMQSTVCLNLSKTEFYLVCNNLENAQCEPGSNTHCDTDILPSASVHNLGIMIMMIDGDFSMMIHVKKYATEQLVMSQGDALKLKHVSVQQ